VYSARRLVVLLAAACVADRDSTAAQHSLTNTPAPLPDALTLLLLLSIDSSRNSELQTQRRASDTDMATANYNYQHKPQPLSPRDIIHVASMSCRRWTRSLHISCGRPAAGSQRADSLGSCAMGQTDRRTDRGIAKCPPLRLAVRRRA